MYTVTICFKEYGPAKKLTGLTLLEVQEQMKLWFSDESAQTFVITKSKASK